MKRINPMLTAILGIVALILIVCFGSWFSRLTVAGNSGIDLTENKVHSLTEGTKAILSELDSTTPVIVRYYATRQSPLLSREQKLFLGKVDALLKKYESLARGGLRVEYLDPQPDTEEEDSARLDGISGQRITLDNQEENIYLGISVSCLDQKANIPSLSAQQDTLLEYELSRAISEVSRVDKPMLGLITSLPLEGAPAQMPGQRPSSPWIFHQMLEQNYDVTMLGMNPDEIDSSLTSLLILHPENVSKKLEYQIDQYLMQGGNVMVCLDPYCYAASIDGNPMMGVGGSDLPNLLKAWEVEFDSSKVVFDLKYKTPLQGGITSPVFLSLNSDAIQHKSEIITQGLNDLVLPFAGSFKTTGNSLTFDPILVGSTNSGTISSIEAGDVRGSAMGMHQNKVDNEAHIFAARLSGDFKSAFPNGWKEEREESEVESNSKTKPEANRVLSSSGKGSVTLLSDADFFADPFAFRASNMMGVQMVQPVNGNSSLLLNIIDQALGSKHLIGSRSRSSARRPFTVIEEMENKFESSVGEKIAQAQAQQQIAISKIKELESNKVQNGAFTLSSDSAAELEKLNQEQVKYAKEVRELQKGLQRQKKELAGSVIFWTIVPVICFVILLGVIVLAVRKSRSMKS